MNNKTSKKWITNNSENTVLPGGPKSDTSAQLRQYGNAA